jgi:hypothetical protein
VALFQAREWPGNCHGIGQGDTCEVVLVNARNSCDAGTPFTVSIHWSFCTVTADCGDSASKCSER